MKTMTFLTRLAGCSLIFAFAVANAQAPAKPPAAAAKAPAAAAKAPAAAAKPVASKEVTAKKSAPVTASRTIIWRGDQVTARAFVNDLAKQYEQQKKGKLILQPFSTISGLDAINGGSADVAGSARPALLGRSEEARISFYPIAWDALVAITSPKNPVSNLSLKQLHDIYLGKITNWKSLGGNAVDINVYAVAGPLDGVEFSTRQLLYGNGDQRVAAPRLYINTEKLEEGIALDPAAIGLSTLSAVYPHKEIKMLRIDNIAASSTSIADGSYPLYSPLYLASREDAPSNAAVQEFVRFTSSPSAKALLRQHQLVPYGDGLALAEKQNERLASIQMRVGGQPRTEVAAAPSETPVSAPNATLAAKERIAPGAASTQEARDRAARAKEAKAAAKKPGAK